MNIWRVLFLSLLFLLVAYPAYAYIDPGMGSMLIQAIVAVLVAGGIFWRNILYMFKKLFKKGKRKI